MGWQPQWPSHHPSGLTGPKRQLPLLCNVPSWPGIDSSSMEHAHMLRVDFPQAGADVGFAGLLLSHVCSQQLPTQQQHVPHQCLTPRQQPPLAAPALCNRCAQQHCAPQCPLCHPHRCYALLCMALTNFAQSRHACVVLGRTGKHMLVWLLLKGLACIRDGLRLCGSCRYCSSGALTGDSSMCCRQL